MTIIEHKVAHAAAELALRNKAGHQAIAATAAVLLSAGLSPAIATAAAGMAVTGAVAWGFGRLFKAINA